MDSTILVSYANNNTVAIVSLNVPKKMNAVSFEMFAQLEKIIDSLQQEDKDVRAIILNGTGKNFTAGLDLQSAMAIGGAQGAVSDEVDGARVGIKIFS